MNFGILGQPLDDVLWIGEAFLVHCVLRKPESGVEPAGHIFQAMFAWCDDGVLAVRRQANFLERVIDNLGSTKQNAG